MQIDPVIRISKAPDATGRARCELYGDMKAGVFVKPFKVGVRAVGVFASEIAAINAAKAAGASVDELRRLVVRLEAARRTRFEKLAGEAAAA